jgi:hypothetical protein
MEGAAPGVSPPAPPEFDLLTYLAQLSGGPQPTLVTVIGPAGSGKSSLLRAVVPRLPDPKVFMGFSSARSVSPHGEPEGAEHAVAVILVHPDWAARTDGIPGTSSEGSRLAIAPVRDGAESSVASPLAETLMRMAEAPRGVLVVDSWDRGTEEFFQAQAKGATVTERFTAPMIPWAGVHSAIMASPVRFLITALPENADPLVSLADAVVLLHEEVFEDAKLRVVSVTKVRGTPPAQAEHLYTLAGGIFRPFPALPRGVPPALGSADPDPDPADGSIWPGSEAFYRAFGRLGYSSATGVLLSEDCPDGLAHVLAVPLAVHVLRAGGRVAWVPSPSIRATRVIAELNRWIPTDSLRDGFRVLSAGSVGPVNPEFEPCLISPAPPTGPETGAHPPSSAPGVLSPILEIHRFLRDRPGSSPSVLLVSLEGVHANRTAAGIDPPKDLLPVLMEEYTRIPRFHLFGYASVGHASVPLLRPAVATLLSMGVACGRPFLAGSRPKTSPYVLDWGDPRRTYDLIPVR